MKRSCRLRAPARQFLDVRGLPESGNQTADQQLLHQTHAGVRRHLKASQLQQTKTITAGVGRVELVDAKLCPVRVAGHVDEQMAEHSVSRPGRVVAELGDLPEGKFQLVQAVVARLVHSRSLACRAEERATE